MITIERLSGGMVRARIDAAFAQPGRTIAIMTARRTIAALLGLDPTELRHTGSAEENNGATLVLTFTEVWGH